VQNTFLILGVECVHTENTREAGRCWQQSRCVFWALCPVSGGLAGVGDCMGILGHTLALSPHPPLPAMPPPAAKQGRTYANFVCVRSGLRPDTPCPPFPLETIRQSAGLGVAVAAAATSTVGSGAGAAPAARRPARVPRRRRGTETAARSALRTPARYPSTPQPPRIAQRANLRPLRADFPSPPAPPSPRPCRTWLPCP